jgi:hypothetical protein
MFLRVVRATVSKGVKRDYIRVVEAYRDDAGKTQHRTVINLGRRDLLAAHLDLDKLGRLLHGDAVAPDSVKRDGALVLVTNRLTAPGSEHALALWLDSDFVCDRDGWRFVA